VILQTDQTDHVPFEGRTLIREKLTSLNKRVSFLELPAAHAFIRDESSKGRYEYVLRRCVRLAQRVGGSSSLSRLCFDLLMDLFDRNLCRDLGERKGPDVKPPDVC
jgi:carboxymethylenebutenolidase